MLVPLPHRHNHFKTILHLVHLSARPNRALYLRSAHRAPILLGTRLAALLTWKVFGTVVLGLLNTAVMANDDQGTE